MTYKCPACGTVLLYDYETEESIIFYCINCKKNVKARKGVPIPEKLKGLNNLTVKTKAYYPDEAFEVIDIINNPKPADKEFIKAMEGYNKTINKRIK